jgi:hypothetical protein
VLSDILAKEEMIDILKIDVESLEIPIIKAIDPAFFPRIKTIYVEKRPKTPLLPEHFVQAQYGSVCRLRNRLSPLAGVGAVDKVQA